MRVPSLVTLMVTVSPKLSKSCDHSLAAASGDAGACAHGRRGAYLSRMSRYLPRMCPRFDVLGISVALAHDEASVAPLGMPCGRHPGNLPRRLGVSPRGWSVVAGACC